MISLVAYVITKIAVGIYAGGIVSDTLLPEMSYKIGGFTLDSFWIGSVLVVLLTGLYTVLGGMRAVAYTEALQTIILIVGSVLVTYFGLQRIGGWEELRRIAQSDRPAGTRRDVQPVEAGRAGKRHLGTRSGKAMPPAKSSASLVLQRELSVARHAVLRADHRPVVLVHRSVHRAAALGAPNRNAGPPRLHFLPPI